tara:strand:+ start:5512 stop:6198 length:687 start_codon:yes stop_codon:yes gene_type:complete
MFGKVLKSARFFGAALFLCALASPPALAHPHVWIDMQTDLVMGKDNSLDAITITWTFDEFYTAFAVEEFKKQPDGSFAPKDLAALLDTNLENLKEWDYFTQIKQSGKPLKLATAKPGGSSYDAKLGRLTVTFTVPLAQPATPTPAEPVLLRIYDPTYYISIDYIKQTPARIPIRLTGTPATACSYTSKIPNAESVWAGLPASAFTGADSGTGLGSNFAATVTLTCNKG